MKTKARFIQRLAIEHWFVLVYGLAIVIGLFIWPTLLRDDTVLAEMVILFDLSLFLPIIYLLCYRSKQFTQQIALRIMGLAGLGIFLVSWIVPEDMQQILPNLSLGRNFVLVVVILIELIAFIAILKMIFAKDADPDEIAKKSGAPEIIIKLMLLEARFWKVVWNFFKPSK